MRNYLFELPKVIDLSGSTQFSYDVDGNVIAKGRTIAGGIYYSSMTYDALGRETTLIYPDGMQVNESYDASALSIVQSTSGITYATLTYSATAPMKLGQVAYGNGVNASYAYDPSMYRLSSLISKVSTTTLQNFGYQYDNVGNISYISDSVGPMTAAYAYDGLDRLIQAAGPYGTNNYAYDSIGNFTLNSDNASGFWNFDDLSAVSPIAGVAVSTSGRIGNGVGFNDGATTVSINNSSGVAPPATMTIALWARPRSLGTGYLVAKGGSFSFPQITSGGAVQAQLQLSSGLQTVSVSSAPLSNLWSYFVMTYDGSNINVYVNGQLWTSQAATGTITVSTQPIVLGSGLTGAIDELSVYPYALSASQVLQRYQLYPNLGINQPNTPNSVPADMTAGVWYSTYTFSFQAWDLNGNNLDYLVNWGDGSPNQDLGTVQSGSVVQATHTWTAAGQFSIQVQGVEASTSSVWSPSCNILISTYSISTAMSLPILIGASANASYLAGSGRIESDTDSEVLTGFSHSTQTWGFQGYQGTSIAQSSFTTAYLGQQGPGGVDASPTPELSPTDLIGYSTMTAMGTIALNLLEHGTTTYTDGNGNFIVENGKWLAFDFENRPIAIVNEDATLSQFTYDFEGNRNQQIVTLYSQVSSTTTYVGGIYEMTPSTSTLKYITAGPLRVAMIDQSGSANYFLPDHLGSTNLLVNGEQGLVRTNDYLPFGGTYITNGSIDDDHKFTGQRLDANSGLYYYGARYYDPMLSHFVTPDATIQNLYDPQTLNRYVYCRNNPIIFMDPTGNSFLGSIGNFFSSVGNFFTQDLAGFFEQTAGQTAGQFLLNGIERGATAGYEAIYRNRQAIANAFKEFGEKDLAVALLGYEELDPDIFRWSYKNRYYLAAGAITAGTFGVAAPEFDVGAALFTDVGVAQTAAIGAFVGEATTLVPGVLNGENGQQLLFSTLEQGGLGGLQAAAGYEFVNFLPPNNPLSIGIDVAAAGAIGGTKDVISGTINGTLNKNTFIQGFVESAALAATVGIVKGIPQNTTLGNLYYMSYANSSLNLSGADAPSYSAFSQQTGTNYDTYFSK